MINNLHTHTISLTPTPGEMSPDRPETMWSLKWIRTHNRKSSNSDYQLTVTLNVMLLHNFFIMLCLLYYLLCLIYSLNFHHTCDTFQRTNILQKKAETQILHFVVVLDKRK